MTRFSFGNRGVIGQHAAMPGRVHGVLPGNAGISHSAQERVDLLSSSASRKASEAISGIDAVQLFVFQPLKHGPQCNCGTEPTTDTELVPPSNPYTLGVAEDDTNNVDDFETGPVKARVRDITPQDYRDLHNPDDEIDVMGDAVVLPVSSTSGMTDPFEPGSTSTGPYEGPMSGNGDLKLHSGAYDHEQPDSALDTMGEELIDDYDDNAWNPESVLNDNAYVMGATINTCPICMGSGIIGGYGLHGATRVVLSTANYSGGNNSGPDKSTTPPHFALQPGEYVTWSLSDFANYFTFGWAGGRNLRRKLRVTIEYSLDGTVWYPIASLGQHSTVNLSGLTLKVTNDRDDPFDLTHIELVVFHSITLGQVTNFNQAAGKVATVKGDSLTITLPPEVGQTDRNALVGEAKYKLMWRVTVTTPIQTAKGQIINCELSGDLMEASLVETLLYPYYNVEGAKQRIYGAGVEPVQGMR